MKVRTRSLRRHRLSARASIVAGAAALTALAPAPAHAYIGPGAGFAVIGSFLVVAIAIALGLLILATWPARFLLRRLRRRRSSRHSRVKRAVVLGFDGMDPRIAESMMASGRLPHLSRLREEGFYAPMATSCPAMSPTAWSSFATGTGAGRHGIFDFLHRDPRTYLPTLSSAEIRPPRRFLRIGKLQLPLGRPRLRLLRRSRSFWSILGEHGILSTVLRVPITFPPERFRGLLLSGMCVPDLRGSQGSFTLFTTARRDEGETTGGLRLPLEAKDGWLHGSLPGPSRIGGGEAAVCIPLRLRVSGTGGVLELDHQRISLVTGRHSDWITVTFPVGLATHAGGICRFCLRRTDPHVDLYVTPIHIDPERAALPVSHPAVYSVYLAKKLGRFGTLGLAEDTWALNEGALDDTSFLEQCRLLLEERRQMLLSALDTSRDGCIVCVFDTTDRVQHMYWRYRHAGHPAPLEDGGGDFRTAIETAYEEADAIVGAARARLGRQDALFVMSDHGFTDFSRGVNLNTWLQRHGYLALKPGAAGTADWLADVDWTRTRAYAIGLAGVYLNVAEREAHGIVPSGEVEHLKYELIEALSGLHDAEKDTPAISRVFDTATATPGPYASEGPDLVIGYAAGYRASWDAARGRVAGEVFEDNTRRWSGDHCVDPRHVPGVLFCDQRLPVTAPRIIDMAPTLLSLFGVPVPAYMQGRSLLDAARQEAVAHG